jgi:phosphoribosylglycinamide formyltransferase 1
MKKIAVFASGNGSNFQSIVDYIKEGKLKAHLALLVCDKPGAKVIERAKNAQIPSFVFNPKSYESKEHFEQDILQQLIEYEIDLIVLAGYMRLIGPTLLQPYQGKIMNIHPSLLPSFPGKNAIEQALEAGVKITGVTIHYVDEGMDTGPIIAQRAVEISEVDNAETLAQKIHQVEHTFYPEIIQQWINENK